MSKSKVANKVIGAGLMVFGFGALYVGITGLTREVKRLQDELNQVYADMPTHRITPK